MDKYVLTFRTNVAYPPSRRDPLFTPEKKAAYQAEKLEQVKSAFQEFQTWLGKSDHTNYNFGLIKLDFNYVEIFTDQHLMDVISKHPTVESTLKDGPLHLLEVDES